MAKATINGEREAAWKRYLSPWKLALILVAMFLMYQGYQWLRDQELVAALEGTPEFASPELSLTFPKGIQYDPLSFVGRGARAGWWRWTPAGLVLTEEGGKYFRMEDNNIVSHGPAGRRRFSRLRERSAQPDAVRLVFFYRWEQISPPATTLLTPPPQLGSEYLARAVLRREGDTWRLVSLEARDFDEPLQRLRDVASGVLR